MNDQSSDSNVLMPEFTSGGQSNREDVMTNRLILSAAAVLAISLAPLATAASAASITDALTIKNAVPTNIETVQWRGRTGGAWRGRGGRSWRGGRGWGGGFGPGFVGGAILGGMLAAPGYYYGPGPYYYDYEPGYGGNAVGYCMQRFKSYDPGSGTYLGYDGRRHSCP